MSTKQRQKSEALARTTGKMGHRRVKSYFADVDFKIGSRHCDNIGGRLDRSQIYTGPPLIDTKAFKQAFLAGDKQAVMYCPDNGPKGSLNQQTLKGI